MEAHIIQKAIIEARLAVARAMEKVEAEFTYGDEGDEAVIQWCEETLYRLDDAVWLAVHGKTLV